MWGALTILKTFTQVRTFVDTGLHDRSARCSASSPTLQKSSTSY